jgi:hypothetical protein
MAVVALQPSWPSPSRTSAIPDGASASTPTGAAQVIVSIPTASDANGSTKQRTAAGALNTLAPATATGGLVVGTGTNSFGLPGQCLTVSAGTTPRGSCASDAVVGTGTTNSLTKFMASSTISNSQNSDDGTLTTIGDQLVPGGPSPWVDLSVYGAKADSTTDNGPALQKALDACPTGHGGCTISVPPSTNYYYVKTGVTTTRDHVSLVCLTANGKEGHAPGCVFESDQPITILKFGKLGTTHSGPYISGINFQDLSAAQNHVVAAIELDSMEDFKLDKVVCAGVKVGACVKVVGNSANSWSQWGSIYDLQTMNVKYGIQTSGLTSAISVIGGSINCLDISASIGVDLEPGADAWWLSPSTGINQCKTQVRLNGAASPLLTTNNVIQARLENSPATPSYLQPGTFGVQLVAAGANQNTDNKISATLIFGTDHGIDVGTNVARTGLVGNIFNVGAAGRGGNNQDVVDKGAGTYALDAAGLNASSVTLTSGPIISQFTATAALKAGQVVKLDTARADAVVVATTTDTGAGLAVGIVQNSAPATGTAQVAVAGKLPPAGRPLLGTGTCLIGNFVIVDTTTNGRVKCATSYRAGTIIGYALAAQPTVGGAVDTFVQIK